MLLKKLLAHVLQIRSLVPVGATDGSKPTPQVVVDSQIRLLLDVGSQVPWRNCSVAQSLGTRHVRQTVSEIRVHEALT